MFDGMECALAVEGRRSERLVLRGRRAVLLVLDDVPFCVGACGRTPFIAVVSAFFWCVNILARQRGICPRTPTHLSHTHPLRLLA